jgi:hypothetical protein
LWGRQQAEPLAGSGSATFTVLYPVGECHFASSPSLFGALGPRSQASAVSARCCRGRTVGGRGSDRGEPGFLVAGLAAVAVGSGRATLLGGRCHVASTEYFFYGTGGAGAPTGRLY